MKLNVRSLIHTMANFFPLISSENKFLLACDLSLQQFTFVTFSCGLKIENSF